jgi:thiol-disulfide isomerase/thioredoxin
MPHLSELVKLHADEPFALVGVNAFDAKAAYIKGLKDYAVTWISAYQGDEEAPIADLYRVEGYPTYVLLDAQGRIVAKGHSSEAMDRPIEKLLAQMKEK